MKEIIDRDLSKYLESWQPKEGCGLRAETWGGIGEEKLGEKGK